MSQLIDGFSQVLGSLSEAYSEVVTANNASASPAVHDQTQPAVEANGEPVSYSQSAVSWLASNWLFLLLGLIALAVIVFMLKWAFK